MSTKEQAAKLSLVIARICDDRGILKTFSKFMGDLTKDSPSWDSLKKEYNEGKDLLIKALKESADDSTLRVKLSASLTSPEKHKAIASNGFTTGSVAYLASESVRKEKSKAFWDGIGNALPEEMGLTDKEFWILARHNGHVSPDWKKLTVTGNMAFNAASEAAYVADYKAKLIAERAGKAAVTVTEEISDAINAKLTKEKKAATKAA